MKYILFALLFVTGCKPLVEKKPQTRVVATACVDRSLIFQYITAERQKNGELRKYLMENGCFALPPYMEIEVIERQNSVAHVEVSKLGMMRLAPGMEKLDNVRAWVKIDDLAHLGDYIKQASLEK